MNYFDAVIPCVSHLYNLDSTSEVLFLSVEYGFEHRNSYFLCWLSEQLFLTFAWDERIISHWDQIPNSISCFIISYNLNCMLIFAYPDKYIPHVLFSMSD